MKGIEHETQLCTWSDIYHAVTSPHGSGLAKSAQCVWGKCEFITLIMVIIGNLDRQDASCYLLLCSVHYKGSTPLIGTMVRNTISMAKRVFTNILQIRLFLLLLLIKNLTRCFYIFLLYNKRKGLLCSLLCCKNIIYVHTGLLFLVIILSNLLYPVMEAIFYPSYYFHSVLGPIRWQDYTSTE